jgi:hypothetical protein
MPLLLLQQYFSSNKEAFAISIPVNSITMFEIKILPNDLEQFLLDKVYKLHNLDFQNISLNRRRNNWMVS